MKPYGVPRVHDIGAPDLLASHISYLPGKGGDVCSSFKNARKKESARRVWARRARAEGKALAFFCEE